MVAGGKHTLVKGNRRQNCRRTLIEKSVPSFLLPSVWWILKTYEDGGKGRKLKDSSVAKAINQKGKN
jgi:hypothetical protein